MGLFHATLLRATAILGLAVVSLTTGCTRTATIKVPIEGLLIPREYAPSIEVSNWKGNVLVYASDQYSKVEVRARARALDKSAARNASDLRKLVSVRAVSSQDGARRLLKVTGAPTSNPSAPVAIDIQVRIPRAADIRVVNTGGEVELVGVGGPITVENGSPGEPGGEIQVRTGIPIREPVTLSTTSGPITYQVGPGSTGEFDLQTSSGEPEVFANIGTFHQVQMQPNRWRGTLEDGANPIRLSSGKGDLKVKVIDNAATLGREYWDGWPEWENPPRWIAKIRGD